MLCHCRPKLAISPLTRSFFNIWKWVFRDGSDRQTNKEIDGRTLRLYDWISLPADSVNMLLRVTSMTNYLTLGMPYWSIRLSYIETLWARRVGCSVPQPLCRCSGIPELSQTRTRQVSEQNEDNEGRLPGLLPCTTFEWGSVVASPSWREQC